MRYTRTQDNDDEPGAMTLLINGEERDVPEGATIRELLAVLEISTDLVAVEVNGELVPRTQFDRHVLQAGDRLEIVTLVGGG